MLRRQLIASFLALQVTTFVGVFIVGMFLMTLTNIRLQYLLSSGWIVLAVAALLLAVHAVWSLSLIAPTKEVEDEVGLGNASLTQSRRALDALLGFIPRTASLTVVFWGLGSLLVGGLIYVRHPVTGLDVVSLVLGGLATGLIIAVIHYHGMKARFAGIIGLLLERAGVDSPHDSVFERHRIRLRTELLVAFGSLLGVTMVFTVLYGYTQTQRARIDAVSTRVQHDIGMDMTNLVGPLDGVAYDEPGIPERMTSVFQVLYPSANGRYLFVTPEGGVIGEDVTDANSTFDALSEGEIEVIRSSGETDWLTRRNGGVLLWRPAYGGRLVAQLPEEDIPGRGANVVGTLLILVAVLLCLLLGISFFVARSVTLPILELRTSLMGLASGDLTVQRRVGGITEVGELGLSATATISSLRTTIGQIRNAHGRVTTASSRVEDSSREVRSVSSEQADHLRRTVGALSTVERVVREVAQNVEELATLSQGAVDNTAELRLATRDVEVSATEVNDSVAETNASIYQMAESIAQVSRTMAELREAATDSAQSVSELTSSIRQVESDASQTARSAEQVLADAEAGTQAVSWTMEGIGDIRQATKEAVTTIQDLSDQMNQVGSVVTVIQEIAAQTHLLSLNAAIIAAQAGEHGQGFAVVADEIKKLALRTNQSTQSIGDILDRIRVKAETGVEKVMAGEEAVERGTMLSEQARAALSQIESSARETVERMARIARATSEQSSSVEQINRGVDEMAELVETVTKSTEEQRKGADQIAAASESLRAIARRVNTVAERQTESTQSIQQSMERIAAMVDTVLQATREQLAQLRSANAAAEQTGQLAGRNLELTEQLQQVVVDLSQESDALTKALSRFRV